MEGGAAAIGTRAATASAAFARARPWQLFAIVFASMVAAVALCVPLFGDDAPLTLYVAMLLGMYTPALLWVRHHLRRAGVSAPDYLGEGPTRRDLGPGALIVLSLIALAVADAFLGAELVAAVDRDLLESLYGSEASPEEPYGTPARFPWPRSRCSASSSPHPWRRSSSFAARSSTPGSHAGE